MNLSKLLFNLPLVASQGVRFANCSSIC